MLCPGKNGRRDARTCPTGPSNDHLGIINQINRENHNPKRADDNSPNFPTEKKPAKHAGDHQDLEGTEQQTTHHSKISFGATGINALGHNHCGSQGGCDLDVLLGIGCGDG